MRYALLLTLTLLTGCADEYHDTDPSFTVATIETHEYARTYSITSGFNVIGEPIDGPLTPWPEDE